MPMIAYNFTEMVLVAFYGMMSLGRIDLEYYQSGFGKASHSDKYPKPWLRGAHKRGSGNLLRSDYFPGP